MFIADHLDPVEEDREAKHGGQAEAEDQQRPADFGIDGIRQNGQPQMRAAPGRDGGPHHAQQHKEVRRDLFREGEGQVQDIAGEHIGKNQRRHGDQTEDADALFDLVEYLHAVPSLIS